MGYCCCSALETYPLFSSDILKASYFNYVPKSSSDTIWQRFSDLGCQLKKLTFFFVKWPSINLSIYLYVQIYRYIIIFMYGNSQIFFNAYMLMNLIELFYNLIIIKSDSTKPQSFKVCSYKKKKEDTHTREYR